MENFIAVVLIGVSQDDIEEAVYLSNRILIMTPRPGSIIRSYEIDLPYPRKRTDKAFSNLVTKISQDLQKEFKLI